MDEQLLKELKEFLELVKDTDTGTGNYLEDRASELLDRLKE